MDSPPPDAARVPAPSGSGRVPRWLRHGLRTVLHLGLDGAAVAAAYRAAYELRFHWPWWTEHFPLTGKDPGWAIYEELLFTIVPLWIALFGYSSRLYTRAWRSPFDRLLGIGKGALLGTLATLVATYIYGRLAYSRLMLLMAGPLACAAVALAQALVLRLDAWLALWEETSPLLLVGGGRVAELVGANIRARHPRVALHELAELPSSTEETVAAARAVGASELVLVRADHDRQRLLALAEACESAGVGFRMIPDLLEIRLGEVQFDDSLGLPAYRLQHTSLTSANFLAKRTFDVAFSLAVLAALGLPGLLVAALIRLESDGPILYRQKRIGFKGRVFEAYKFRTMVAGAEHALASVRDRNDQGGGFFKAKADPRVTGVGRWLRRFSIDEFPQFLNVLDGDMSVVGPRPLAVTTGELDDLVRLFGPTARKRTNILPGITGLWQVSGRSDISAEQRFALDMFYIEHWSLGLDLEIILRTIPAMLSGRGAY